MSVVIYTHVIDTDRGRSLDNLEITIVEALEHARATHFRSIEKWAERKSRGWKDRCLGRCARQSEPSGRELIPLSRRASRTGTRTAPGHA
ncbi:hypothetical protein OG520_42790 (plasmid) [Streptomyces sp. NBC_00984]|uniref:hypothetical protein n=1 Tax=Streptomyces sp. NBC_00984 TaxID=2903700 RepID=UPI002F91430A|nr:hypothetical protein OG520_42790 [Streptomyces sp. NBC_00984]